MEKWYIPKEMSSLAGKTVKSYGYDRREIVDYSFNSQGFRTLDNVNKPRLIIVGNTISFGIGLPIEQTYGHLLAQYTNRHVDNRAIGCVLHDNHDYLANIKLLTQQDQDSAFVIQINNLNRQRTGNSVVLNNDPAWCVNHFLEFFDQAEDLLKMHQHTYVYWDNIQYDLPKSILEKIVINNKFHLDSSLPDKDITFGPKTHETIAKVLRYFI